MRTLKALLLVTLIASCAGDDNAAPPSVDDTTTDNALHAFPVDAAAITSLRERAVPLVKPGSVVQIEERLGVPRFVWTKRPAVAKRRADWYTAGATPPEVLAARAAVAPVSSLYGLDASDLEAATVFDIDTRDGNAIVRMTASLDGIEIFAEEMNVLLDRDLAPIAISGFLTPTVGTSAARTTGSFAMDARAAVAAVLGRQAKRTIPTAKLAAISSLNGYDRFTSAELDGPARAKRVYFHLPTGLVPAYYVEVTAPTGAPLANALSSDGNRPTLESFGYVVSATGGQVLWRKNLTDDVQTTFPGQPHLDIKPLTSASVPGNDFTYRVWADASSKVPYDTVAGNAPHPKLVSSPDGAQAAFVSTADVTLASAQISTNDPWLTSGATVTTGNNVEAYTDHSGANGFDGTDVRATITSSGQFLHVTTPDQPVHTSEARQGSVQNLFYLNNFFHDWYYDLGFNEVARNAQTDNYGRGGNPSDSIKAEAQDYSGYNNANMSTPADGGRPTMQMFDFVSSRNAITALGATVAAGAVVADGAETFDVNAPFVAAQFDASCNVTNAAAVLNNIALFHFDATIPDGNASCTNYSSKIATLAGAGAGGIVLIYSSAAPTVVPVFTGTGYPVTPLMATSYNLGQAILSAMAGGPQVGRLQRFANRDGALDNQIVAHEWFHYASNRLVGNAAGLNTNTSRGMGEGWSDFNALLMTVRADDTSVASNATFNGVYATATYATSGVNANGSPNNGYYFGIRRYPYSTDMTKNPLTYRYISNATALPTGAGAPASNPNYGQSAEVHNVGEVWATMLWDCYAGILQDTLGPSPRLTFTNAQTNMRRYVIAGLKMTPSSPTLLDARNALLSVIQASDAADYNRCRAAFARRGLGPHATAPDTASTTNVDGLTEDYSDLDFVSATITPVATCDADAFVDSGETGTLSVTLRNEGATTLSGATATVNPNNANVSFPGAGGATATFPDIASGDTATVAVPFALATGLTTSQDSAFTVSYTAPGFTAQEAYVRARLNDDVATAATDSVEFSPTVWTVGHGTPDYKRWRIEERSATQHEWAVYDPATASDEYLVSPTFHVSGGGPVNLQFDHSYIFEVSGNVTYDGGVVEVSVDGGAFADLDNTQYTGTISSSASGNALVSRRAFVGNSVGTVHTSLSKMITGSTVQFRFRSGSDSSVGAGGWTVDNIAVSGVTEAPFASTTANATGCAADLSITVTDGVTTVTAGGSTTYTITASNAGPQNVTGATVVDTFPAALTCVNSCVGAGGGTCTAGPFAGNIFDTVNLPSGGSVTYTSSCTISNAASGSLSNTATVSAAFPSDPTTPNTATDTDTVTGGMPHLYGDKTVTSATNFAPNSNVTYTIHLTNDGDAPTADNGGTNADEFVDVLPAGLQLISASASSGTATTTGNTATWNGTIAMNGTLTITIVAKIVATSGQPVSNQGTFYWASNGGSTNNATGSTEAFVCSP